VIVRHLTVLHGIFKRAKRVWGLASNPTSADLVERPKVFYTGEFDTYTGDEVELLATAADDAPVGCRRRAPGGGRHQDVAGGADIAAWSSSAGGPCRTGPCTGRAR
jgi:hypothetical protein